MNACITVQIHESISGPIFDTDHKQYENLSVLLFILPFTDSLKWLYSKQHHPLK